VETITVLGVEVAAPDRSNRRVVANIQGRDYLTVEGRLQLMKAVLVAKGHQAWDYEISTRVVTGTGTYAVVMARVKLPWGCYSGSSGADTTERTRSGEQTIASGSPYEVAETSAVGRALGFAGFDPYGQIESAAGMRKAPGMNQHAGSEDRPATSASSASPSQSQPGSNGNPAPNGPNGSYVCEATGREITASSKYTAAQNAGFSWRATGFILSYDARRAFENGTLKLERNADGSVQLVEAATY
jgi:hypothetical protein